jgi:hypothetical protein
MIERIVYATAEANGKLQNVSTARGSDGHMPVSVSNLHIPT